MPAALKSRIPEISAELQVKLQEAAELTAAAIAEEASSRAPVATGRLRDSIDSRPIPGGAAVVAEWYYIFSEFGTVNQGAKPFMVPAAEAGRAIYQTEVRAALRSL